MGVPILGLLAVILYLLGAAQQFSELVRGPAPPPWRRTLLTWLALLAHGGAAAGFCSSLEASSTLGSSKSPR